MLIKRIDSREFDVFWGNGWTNWARFELADGKLHKVKGMGVPYPVVTALKKRYGVKD